MMALLTCKKIDGFFSKQIGFTLIELMLTVGIAAIVSGIAIPGFQTMIKNNRLTATANELVTALNKTRSEAVTRGQRVSICKSADGLTCVTAGDWSQGWMIFTNPNNNSIVDPGEAILNVQGPLKDTLTIIGSNANLASIFSYFPSGTISSTGSIVICDDRAGNFGKTITFVVTGRSSLTTGSLCP